LAVADGYLSFIVFVVFVFVFGVARLLEIGVEALPSRCPDSLFAKQVHR
jgi:hypothetical protein